MAKALTVGPCRAIPLTAQAMAAVKYDNIKKTRVENVMSQSCVRMGSTGTSAVVIFQPVEVVSG